MLASHRIPSIRPIRYSCWHSRPITLNSTFTSTASPSSSINQSSQSKKLGSSLLIRIKEAFPDSSTSQHLHSRIDLLLSKDPTIRVGIVPVQPFSRTSQTLQDTPRRAIKSVLDSVLADPLSSDQKWRSIVRDRNLSKNSVISYAPNFNGSTITHNSIVEYEVPFSVSKEGIFESKPSSSFMANESHSKPLASAPYSAKYQQATDITSEQNQALDRAKYNLSFLEMTSPNDSLQHMLKCHRLIYVTSDPSDAEAIRQDPSRFLPVATPHRVLIDYPAEKLKYTANSTIAKLQKNTQAPVVSSEMQMQANDVLAESPSQNADKYIKLHARANFAAINRAAFLFSTPRRYDDADPDSIDNIGVDPFAKIPHDVFHGTDKPSNVGNLRNAQIELSQTVLHTCSQIVDNSDSVTNAIAKEGSEMGIRRKEWAVEAHTELQTTLEAHLDAMFGGPAASKLKKRTRKTGFLGLKLNTTRDEGKEKEEDEALVMGTTADSIPWYKLYWKVDDVYSIVDEVFLRYYFLPRAQDRYKYLQGRIDEFADLYNLPAEIPASETEKNTKSTKVVKDGEPDKDLASVTTIKGPKTLKSIQNTKNGTSTELFDKTRSEILSTAGVELHKTAMRTLLTSIFGVQVPLLVLPLCAVYLLDYCSLYAAGSVMALGMAVGFSRLQTGWLRAAGKFKAAVLEAARLSINNAERELAKRWEARVTTQERVTLKRRDLVNELKSALDEESSH